MGTLERAIDLAAIAHKDQSDKAGNPYIAHPMRVALDFIRSGDETRAIIAVLHDVIEDTNITADALLNEGFSNAIVDAIVALSRQDGESYEAFLDRAASNELARPVKIADLRDNMDASRIALLPSEKAGRLLAKYEGAMQRLNRLEPSAAMPEQSQGE
ncbi:HD domain-containing protein [Bosea sp. 47.2.35]|uniref:HD domain-containing protein n=1 Tax=Bosea sp. 47.2.35 TaxID=2969304 RepID=UPI0021504BAF|nr:HD domain-containing protein [Bosea sp. 47.2.35]MCR4524127.1 HD domain-containing protein [Bosea sp. 47.2.35]